MPTDTSPAPSTAPSQVARLTELQRCLVEQLVTARVIAQGNRVRIDRWLQRAEKDEQGGYVEAAQTCRAYIAELEAEADAYTARADELWRELTGGES